MPDAPLDESEAASDRAMFAFVEAQSRLDYARRAKHAADAEDRAANVGLIDAFANLTEAQQRRVNAAYADERNGEIDA